MIVTVFRSRLMPGVREEYVALVDRMVELAVTMPGYISHKGFFADDGERVTVVEFEHEEGHAGLAHAPGTPCCPEKGARNLLFRIQRSGMQFGEGIQIQTRGARGELNFSVSERRHNAYLGRRRRY